MVLTAALNGISSLVGRLGLGSILGNRTLFGVTAESVRQQVQSRISLQGAGEARGRRASIATTLGCMAGRPTGRL